MSRMENITHPLRTRLQKMGINLTLEQTEEMVKETFDVLLENLDNCGRCLIQSKAVIKKEMCRSPKPFLTIRDLRKKKKPGD